MNHSFNIFARYVALFALSCVIVWFWIGGDTITLECNFEWQSENADGIVRNVVFYATTDDPALSGRQCITVPAREGINQVSLPRNTTKIRIDPRRIGAWNGIDKYPVLHFDIGGCAFTRCRVEEMTDPQKTKHIGYLLDDANYFNSVCRTWNWKIIFAYVFLTMIFLEVLIRFAFRYGCWFLLVTIAALAIFPASHLSSEEKSVKENRNLAKFPSVSDFSPVDPVKYSKAIEDAFNDRFRGRDCFTECRDSIKNCFDLPMDGKACFGEDDWLFLNETLPGMRKEEDRMVNGIIGYLTSIGKWAKAREKKFVVLISPDKSRVYDDKIRYYTDWAVQNPKVCLSDLVVAAARTNEYLTLIYPRQTLKGARESSSFELYFRHDTHWNDEGAYIGGFAPVMKCLGVPEKCHVSAWNEREINAEKGDLIRMCAVIPKGRLQKYRYRVPQFESAKKVSIVTEGAAWGSRQMSNSQSGAGCLFCVRDSFMCWGLQYFARQFKNACFLWRYQLKSSDLPDMEKADVILFEVVERNLPALRNMRLPMEVK